MELFIRPLPLDLSDDVEVVEHKGIGHPDTMCDALAESFGVALAKHYIEKFGGVLHFNVDKALLVGGASEAAFRGGRVTAPIQLLFAGRATREVRGVRIPVDEIAVETGKAWVRQHLHALDADRHISWSCLVRGGSTELVDLFLAPESARRGPWLANDTSVGAGYAPATVLEQIVLAAAGRLRTLSETHAEVGEDIKVMGVRRRNRIGLTVACAFIGQHLSGIDDYAARRRAVREELTKVASELFGGLVTVEVNMADDLAAGRVYLTVTGTSAEAGDDGQVGRGNRVNGLITPYRPMSLEASAGKNPSSHVGKLYNVAAHRIATTVVEHVPEVAEAHCFLLSRIGQKVDDPVMVDIRLRPRPGVKLSDVEPRVAPLVRESIAAIPTLASEILAGRIRLY